MIKKFARFLGRFVLYFFLSTILVTIAYRFIPVYFTPLMFIRMVEQFENDKPVQLNRTWVPYDEINASIPLAVVAAEDQQFMYHWGVDPAAIQKAVKYNQKKKGKRLHGASTITQQTAKNVFLWPARNYVRKALEIYFSLLIELLWPKERILEVYLNIVETGNGVYGVEAAAQKYFHKSAAQINRSQAALIASALPDPRRRNPGRPSAYMIKRKSWIIAQMRNLGSVDWKKQEEEIKKGKPRRSGR